LGNQSETLGRPRQKKQNENFKPGRLGEKWGKRKWVHLESGAGDKQKSGRPTQKMAIGAASHRKTPETQRLAEPMKTIKAFPWTDFGIKFSETTLEGRPFTPHLLREPNWKKNLGQQRLSHFGKTRKTRAPGGW